jgi:hypothetical protein
MEALAAIAAAKKLAARARANRQASGGADTPGSMKAQKAKAAEYLKTKSPATSRLTRQLSAAHHEESSVGKGHLAQHASKLELGAVPRKLGLSGALGVHPAEHQTRSGQASGKRSEARRIKAGKAGTADGLAGANGTAGAGAPTAGAGAGVGGAGGLVHKHDSCVTKPTSFVAAPNVDEEGRSVPYKFVTADHPEYVVKVRGSVVWFVHDGRGDRGAGGQGREEKAREHGEGARAPAGGGGPDEVADNA